MRLTSRGLALPTTTLSTGDYSLATGLTQRVVDANGFFLTTQSGFTPPSLTISGALEVTSDAAMAPNPPLSGVDVDGFNSFFQNSVLRITSSGSIRADTTLTFNEAYGVHTGAWSPRVINDGTVDAEAKTHAWGMNLGGLQQADQAVTLLNRGTIVANSVHQATGVSLLMGGSVENSGHILASGTGGVVGLWYSQGYSSLINTGEIRAVDTGGGQSTAVVFASELAGNLRPTPVDIGIWRNDGVIAGDVALKIIQTSSTEIAQVFVNNGQMFGAVQADLGRQTLVNSGVIQGAVDLGGDNDIYDGRLGSASGMVAGGSGADSLAGGARFDSLQGNMGDDTVDGGSGGSDWLVGGQGADQITAHADQNILYGNLGNDTLQAGSGGDLLRGGQGDDSITGGSGNDWISGDRGNDTISGGAGADIFHGSQDAGIDRVVDFNLAQGDRVMLDPGTTYTLMQVGADTVLDMGGGHQMILVGVSMASLTPGWVFGA